jgi:cytochrome c-type biogenesis protein CcmE
VRFVVTDTAQGLPVVYSGALPDLFREGKMVGRAGPARRRRRVPCARSARQARRELHAAEAKEAVEKAHQAGKKGKS